MQNICTFASVKGHFYRMYINCNTATTEGQDLGYFFHNC